MPDRHKYPPLRFRPPEPERLWLLAYAERTGMAVNAILAAALAEFRARNSGPTAPVTSGPTTTRKSRARKAAPPATFKPAEPESASDIMAALRRARGEQ